MRSWKFSQKDKLNQKFFTYSEKEVGNFFKTGTTVLSPDRPFFFHLHFVDLSPFEVHSTLIL